MSAQPVEHQAQRPAHGPGLPVAVVPLLAGVRALAEVDFAATSAEQRAAWLAGLRQLADATEAVLTRVLTVFDTQGDHQVLSGAQSAAAWLRSQLRLAPGDASARAQLARTGPGSTRSRC